jgi:hypothetical protein
MEGIPVRIWPIVWPICNQSASAGRYARIGISRLPGAIMDPRSLEDLPRNYAPPLRVGADVPETVKFAVKELAEIDAWARRNKIESRSEAIRRLVERALKA